MIYVLKQMNVSYSLTGNRSDRDSVDKGWLYDTSYMENIYIQMMPAD